MAGRYDPSPGYCDSGMTVLDSHQFSLDNTSTVKFSFSFIQSFGLSLRALFPIWDTSIYPRQVK
jgi:hypothetical protein